MDLFETVSKDIMAAMKSRDQIRLEALRNIKKYFLEAKTAPGANNELGNDAALKIIQKLAKQGKETAEMFQQNGRNDLAEHELAQVKVIEEYLPKQLSEEEITKAVNEIIASTGASSIKEMGKVIGAAQKQLAGQADGKTISNIVKQLLS